MLRLSPDESFHFELLRLLVHATYGGTDVGEVLAIASEITPGDFESFHGAFVERADRILEQAHKLTNLVSIRDAMTRASTYYRAADFYLHGQICARRYQGIGFTHEWKTVVSPVLNFLETLPIFNMKEFGIGRNSTAGLLAAHAAAFDQYRWIIQSYGYPCLRC
ncbi:hypothetical protein CNYM01_07192 [Colletotrichum nymphaeae SA-01]|uniref:Uncharacterized protein n=1 Tax=Colletotrichum nymphaeae SA-01 TaxID=1460502 RepID=A0A135RQC6_9PEZI|nr:hypothetical protein CNYM01_07192 [Colletotrichum nymphaeae SA-01]